MIRRFDIDAEPFPPELRQGCPPARNVVNRKPAIGIEIRLRHVCLSSLPLNVYRTFDEDLGLATNKNTIRIILVRRYENTPFPVDARPL